MAKGHQCRKLVCVHAIHRDRGAVRGARSSMIGLRPGLQLAVGWSLRTLLSRHDASLILIAGPSASSAL